MDVTKALEMFTTFDYRVDVREIDKRSEGSSKNVNVGRGNTLPGYFYVALAAIEQGFSMAYAELAIIVH